MHRIKGKKEYYVLPGGGKEEHESLEECAIREVKEEMGVDCKIIRKLYEIESNVSVIHVYLMEYVGGQFGSGKGEEFAKGTEFGEYMPELIEQKQLDNLTIYPTILQNELLKDVKQFGLKFDENCKYLYDDFDYTQLKN